MSYQDEDEVNLEEKVTRPKEIIYFAKATSPEQDYNKDINRR